MPLNVMNSKISHKRNIKIVPVVGVLAEKNVVTKKNVFTVML